MINHWGVWGVSFIDYLMFSGLIAAWIRLLILGSQVKQLTNCVKMLRRKGRR